MGEVFERKFIVGWRDVDPNGHVANMTYLQYAVDTRIAFFASCGFPPANFLKQGFGPVIKTDFTEYFREAVLLDELRVTIENGGFSADGSRFRVVNSVFNKSDDLSARVTSVGGWLSLKERRLVAPPAAIKEAWARLPLTADFEELPSSIGSGRRSNTDQE